MLVTFTDGTSTETTVLPADRVAFERRYDLPFDNDEDVRDEWLLFVAFASLQRQGYTLPGIVFDQWLQLVASVAP